MGGGECFVCGPQSSVGLQLDFVVDRKRRQAECEAVVADRYRGWSGLVHGGIIAAMFDGAMVHACTSIDLVCVTAELNITFKKPVPLNTTINVRAEVKSRRTLLAYTVVYTEAIMEVKGVLAGRARAKMFARSDLT
jgi:uncharacterized protein (TIGR00369 family)